MGEEILGGVPEQIVFSDLGQTDGKAGREVDIEDEDDNVVCGTPALAISGFESQGFIFSEIVRRKRLEGHTLSFDVFVDTARPPQCEFSNLQSLPLIFYLDFLAGRSWNSIRLVMSRALKPEDEFVRLFFFSVCLFWETICWSGCLRDLSNWRVGIRDWSFCFHFGGGCPEKGL